MDVEPITRKGNDKRVVSMYYGLGFIDAYPQRPGEKCPPESESGVLAPNLPPTPRDKPPNILGFYVACPPGEKDGLVVIGAGVGFEPTPQRLRGWSHGPIQVL